MTDNAVNVNTIYVLTGDRFQDLLDLLAGKGYANLGPTIKAGAVGYLLKTAPIEEIRRAVYLVYRGGTVFDRAALGTIVQNLRGGAGDEVGHGGLHPRELQVLTLVARGYGNKAIAEHLNISVHTVQSHLSRIFSKLGVSSRTEAVNVALRRRFFTVRDLTQGE